MTSKPFATIEEMAQGLAKPLPANEIAHRKQGNRQVPFLPAHTAISHANEVFGHLGWNMHVLDVKPACQPWQSKSRNGRVLHNVCYIAHVRIDVHDEHGRVLCVKEDAGVCDGSGITIGDAINMAAKGAVSDGMKRALRQLGDYFGNVLYDDDRMQAGDGIENGHQQPAQNNAAPRTATVPPGFDSQAVRAFFLESLPTMASVDALEQLWNTNGDKLAVLKRHFPSMYQDILNAFKERKQLLENQNDFVKLDDDVPF